MRNSLARSFRSPLLKCILVIVGSTFLSTYLSELIPFHKLPLSHFWKVIVERSVESSLIVAAMCLFYPSALERFQLKASKQKLLISLGLVAYLTFPSLIDFHILRNPVATILEGFVFAMFIGINEEIVSRGLIFSALEQYGVWIAATISSVHFGLLHLGNEIWGGQSWSYTSAQILSAGAFGFLCVGLMLYTGNIWIPILLHGLSDTPMQFETRAKFVSEVTGNPHWLPTIALSGVYCAIGWGFIQFSHPDRGKRFDSFFRNLWNDLLPASFNSSDHSK